MAELLTLSGLFSLFTLTIMEIVLGIDNILFISIITNKLPLHQRQNSRRIGLFLALIIRVGLLFSISWLVSLNTPIVTLPFLELIHAHPDISTRDCILLAGGLFLIVQSIREIKEKINAKSHQTAQTKNGLNLKSAIIQIILIDVIFSFDSILTAVGLVRNVYIMIGAVVLSMFVMLLFANIIAQFLDKYQGFKLLALVFLVCIGGLLVLEAFEFHIEKSYVYVAMGLAICIETLHILERKNHIKKVK